MTFNRLNFILASMIFVGVIGSLCAITTLNSYKENNLGTKVTIFLANN